MERRRHSDPQRHSIPQAQESTSPAHLFLPSQLWQTFLYTFMHTKIYTHIHIHAHTSESALLLICSFGFRYSAPAALPPTFILSILQKLPPGLTGSHQLPFPFYVTLAVSVTETLECSHLTVCVIVHNIRLLPHILVDGHNLCYKVILAPGI